MPDSAQSKVASPDQVDLLAPEQLKCPWPSYEVLREQAPVWQDPRTGHFIVSRYEDIRTVLLNPQKFVANLSEGSDHERPEIREMYERDGMLPAVSMLGLDDPLHRHVRGLMDHAFRPARLLMHEPYIESLCNRLVETWIDRKAVDLGADYAAEVALSVMTHLMGVPEQDGPQIRAWTDAWIARISMTMTPEEEVWSAQQEIDAQHYFQEIIERVREAPEENLLSDIVNGVVPDWGHGLSDSQIQIEILVDMFTGGVQTTQHGITSAIKILIERPELWQTVSNDPDRYLANFLEEVVRTDGPQQGDPRFVAEDVELAGVHIPKGSVIHPRWGAGNRDPRRYGDGAAEIDLERDRPRSHLGFGIGTHHCIGATLARREMFFGVKAVLDRVERMWLLNAGDDYVENYIVRGMNSMQVGFTARA